jgi:pimeloyl-ACP methyl ester carboxylesterase
VRRFRPEPFSVFVWIAAAACTFGAAATQERTHAPLLSNAARCPDAPGFTCSTLTVPLDRRGRVRGTLKLRVAAQNGSAPRGVLVFLSGGPGQPGEPFALRVSSRLAAATAGYRLVMFDQRGTGGGALRCPALQAQMGSSDLAVPSKSAVVACAHAVGAKRRFFGTADTVEDLEALRKALHVKKLTLDGVSYGTFVAERYALRYPSHVQRLVLDSVVPQGSADPLSVADAHATARVLRAVCRAEGCKTDPAADLAAVVRRRRGIEIRLLDALVTMSVADPRFPGVATALHSARRGNWGPLETLVERWGPDPNTPVQLFSQGLHASALCADTKMPWGNSAAPPQRRVPALRRAVAQIRAKAIWPFTRTVAVGNGIVKTCLYWPPTPAPSWRPKVKSLPVPTLLLAGDRDLSTPIAWAREEARRAPKGRLVIVHGSGHGTQLRAQTEAGRLAVASFLQTP